MGPRSRQYGLNAAKSAQKRPGADILPVWSQANLVNKRFIMTGNVKEKIPQSQTGKECAILIGSCD